MTLVVKSGGRPMKRPPQEPRRTPWECSCPITHPPFLTACTKCGKKRPKE